MWSIQRFIAVAFVWGIASLPVFAETSTTMPASEPGPVADTAKAPDKIMEGAPPRLVVEYTIEREGKSVDLVKLLGKLEESPGFKEGQCSKIKAKKHNAVGYRCERPGCGLNQAFQDAVSPGVRVRSLSLLTCPSLCSPRVCGGVGYGRCVKLGTICTLCK